MATERQKHSLNDALARATADANQAFGKLGSAVEGQLKEKATQVNVLELTRAAGIPLTEKDLAELQIEPVIHAHPFLPWYVWFPWRPIWCWWWHRHHHYYWYRCCPWWWHGCHRCGCGCH